MEYIDGNVRFSAGDLVNHMACRHLTVLNGEVAAGVRAAPTDWDPTVALMRKRGMEHERNYLQHLEDIGRGLTRIEGIGVDAAAMSDTVGAMRDGADVIVQAALADDRWAGRIDRASPRTETKQPRRLVLRGRRRQTVKGDQERHHTPTVAVLGTGFRSSRRAAGAHVRRDSMERVRTAGVPDDRLRGVLPAGEGAAGVGGDLRR